jgi:hypothetical protein
MHAIRGFEIFVAVLVLGVVVCFCFELSKIHASVGEVFHGYVPSSTLVKSQAYGASSIFFVTTNVFQIIPGLWDSRRHCYASQSLFGKRDCSASSPRI